MDSKKILSGTSKSCDITPQDKSYKYEDVTTALLADGFQLIGEGGFGVIVASHDCVIKLIKDIKRCDELAREREIYEAITRRIPTGRMDLFVARVPKYHLYAELDTWCHVNMERIYSPFSGFGDMEDEDQDFGHGYVIGERGPCSAPFKTPIEKDILIFKEEGKDAFPIAVSDVYLIGRPGNLVHFYINYMIDPNLRLKLEQGQGVLFGPNTLESVFGVPLVETFTFQIGQLLAFLIFDARLIPTDIEVVIGSRGANDRRLCPFIYDFNECFRYKDTFTPQTAYIIARAMIYKNGKHYFPSKGHYYYEAFARGFLDGASKSRMTPQDMDSQYAAQLVLDEYNKGA